MHNLENILVQYATFNWQHLFIDLNSNKSLLYIFCFIFVLIFITRWIFNSKSQINLSSNYTQTESFCPEFNEFKSKTIESGDVLLESILNHKYTRNHIFNSWIVNFNEFKFSQIISKNCRIEEFNENYSNPFMISQIRIIENKELITFTFRMKCARLFLSLQLMYDEKMTRQAHLDMTDIELSALVMIRFTDNGLLLKLFPDCVCDMNCELIVDGISNSEREMSLTEFKRDFKLIMMQTLEVEWKSLPTQDNDVSESDRLNQSGGSPINDAASGDIETSRSVSMENIESVYENRASLEMADCDNSKSESRHKIDLHEKEMMSHMSLFTVDSYNCYEPGEESPFHDRVSSKLIGRTLVVGLIKVVEVQELKNPLKNGYCVLELDEPYQRHVSHLISLTDYPIWNQHFIFSLNSNSQRLTVELFHASKKCQNPISLGVSVIPISLIIVDPSENYFPINNNQIGSRKSWRCDVIPGAAESKIPAFLIEFQIMRNVHDLTKSSVDPISDISSNTSGTSLQLDKLCKTSDKTELDPENGGILSHNCHKMQTIPEAQTPVNTLTKNRSAEDNKIFLREKTNNENGRSKSVIRRIRHRFSRLSVPWISEKSKSDDCLDQIADENETQIVRNSEIPVQPPAELFLTSSNNKPKFFSKISDVDLRNSRSLSISLKKVFNIPSKKQSDKYKEKSLEQLFKDMDPKLFDTISNEGFNRIMNNK